MPSYGRWMWQGCRFYAESEVVPILLPNYFASLFRHRFQISYDSYSPYSFTNGSRQDINICLYFPFLFFIELLWIWNLGLDSYKWLSCLICRCSIWCRRRREASMCWTTYFGWTMPRKNSWNPLKDWNFMDLFAVMFIYHDKMRAVSCLFACMFLALIEYSFQLVAWIDDLNEFLL